MKERNNVISYDSILEQNFLDEVFDPICERMTEFLGFLVECEENSNYNIISNKVLMNTFKESIDLVSEFYIIYRVKMNLLAPKIKFTSINDYDDTVINEFAEYFDCKEDYLSFTDFVKDSIYKCATYEWKNNNIALNVLLDNIANIHFLNNALDNYNGTKSFV